MTGGKGIYSYIHEHTERNRKSKQDSQRAGSQKIVNQVKTVTERTRQVERQFGKKRYKMEIEIDRDKESPKEYFRDTSS